MYRLCTTEKSAAQQRQIEAAFLSMLCELPYDSIKISEICRRAGHSRKVFYRLFEQKADVLYALIDHTLLDYQNYQPDIAVIGRGGMHRFLGFWKEQEKLLDALSASQSSALLTERAVRHILAENAQVMRSFGADSNEFSRETIVFFISGLFALVMDWHKSGFHRSIDEMASVLMQLLMTPPVKNPLKHDPYQ